MGAPVKDMVGRKFNRLLVTGRAQNNGVHVMWNCLCDCGNTKVAPGNRLRSGRLKSCGCLAKEKASIIAKQMGKLTTHGLSHKRAYISYRCMLLRINDPRNPSYDNYKRKGIKICDRWLEGVENFYKDMGERPKGTTLDRIDNSGNYEPNNCRWATPSQQANNRG